VKVCRNTQVCFCYKNNGKIVIISNEVYIPSAFCVRSNSRHICSITRQRMSSTLDTKHERNWDSIIFLLKQLDHPCIDIDTNLAFELALPIFYNQSNVFPNTIQTPVKCCKALYLMRKNIKIATGCYAVANLDK
jgi:hypothetical protein